MGTNRNRLGVEIDSFLLVKLVEGILNGAFQEGSLGLGERLAEVESDERKAVDVGIKKGRGELCGETLGGRGFSGSTRNRGRIGGIESGGSARQGKKPTEEKSQELHGWDRCDVF